MILKIDQIMEIRRGEEIKSENGIILRIIFKNDWFRYELNDREIFLFRHGFSPVEVLRTFNAGQDPVITISCGKHYEQGE